MNPPKKTSVLFITTSYPRYIDDHAGIFVHRFAKLLIKNNYKIRVITPNSKDTPKQDILDGVKINRFNYFFPSRYQKLGYEGGGTLANLRNSWLARLQLPLYLAFMLVKTVKYQNQADLIHCHWLPTALIAILARTFSKKKPPIVFTNWGSDTRLLPQRLINWTLARVDGCISTAAETDEHLIKAGITDFAQIAAPVDEEKFNYQGKQYELHKELNIPESTPIISFVGRLNYFKDPITFIQSCHYLEQQGINYFAVLAGDGDLYEECQSTISDLGLDNKVKLLGMRKDTENIFSSSTLTVHISPIENTWANTIAEAMFMHIPVIMTDVGYTKKTFTDEVDCLIVPAKEPIQLGARIAALLKNTTLQKKLADGAIILLHKHGKYTDEITEKLDHYYKTILTNK